VRRVKVGDSAHRVESEQLAFALSRRREHLQGETRRGRRMKRSMELRHVFCVTFGVAVGGIGGMPGR